jgi:hypothetical protein
MTLIQWVCLKCVETWYGSLFERCPSCDALDKKTVSDKPVMTYAELKKEMES